MATGLTPNTREEQYMAAAAGDRTAAGLPDPVTRKEIYLKAIAENAGGGGGGTSDYSDLSNKPKINNVELSGNKSSSDLGLRGSSDNIDGADINALTGYEEAETAAAISANDSLNVALGKLEKRTGVVENNILSEQAKTTGMSEGGTDYITVGGKRVYVSATAPTGARTGDLWIGG